MAKRGSQIGSKSASRLSWDIHTHALAGKTQNWGSKGGILSYPRLHPGSGSVDRLAGGSSGGGERGRHLRQPAASHSPGQCQEREEKNLEALSGVREEKMSGAFPSRGS